MLEPMTAGLIAIAELVAGSIAKITAASLGSKCGFTMTKAFTNSMLPFAHSKGNIEMSGKKRSSSFFEGGCVIMSVQKAFRAGQSVACYAPMLLCSTAKMS